MIVKLSFPYPNWPIIRQTPASSGRWGEYHFHINQNIEECDYWIVFEGLVTKETVRCSPDNTLFITGEPPTVKQYQKDFLQQFASVISCQRNIEHRSIHHYPQGLPWFVNKSFDDLVDMQFLEKTKVLSIITSNKQVTDGHKKRYEFALRLKETYGSHIDLFGKGINEFTDKWSVLAPYKYSVAIENVQYPDYLTEKLVDCYLSGTFPFYYGCINAEKYFNEEAFSRIDINDFDGCRRIIETSVNDEKHYKNHFPYLIEARELCLKRYNIFGIIADYIRSRSKLPAKPQREISIRPESCFRSSGPTRSTAIDEAVRMPMNLRVIPWVKIQGDQTLRTDYALNEHSIVFDLGGYQGSWSHDIFKKYNCFMHIFEPVPDYVVQIERLFCNNDKIKIHCFGLGNENQTMEIAMDNDGTSLYKTGKKHQTISLIKAIEFLRKNQIDHIDLMKINIEGGEYDLLEHLIDSGFVQNITNIQIQFHDFVPNAAERMQAIQNKLAITHETTYQYLFVWENWAKRQMTFGNMENFDSPKY